MLRGETAGHGERREPRSGLPRRRVVILGATGSIGRQAIEVVEATPELAVVGLAAHTAAEAVVAEATRLGVAYVALGDVEAAAAAARRAPCRVLAGEAGIAELVAAAAADAAADGGELVVLNAIVGAAGLRASLAALRAGAVLALANKESMVAGGRFVIEAAQAGGAAIVPVDSEHSAIFQCLEAGRAGGGSVGVRTGANPLLATEEIVLTGSGGPFRGCSRDELADVSVERALAHPNWVMGPKVTIDSATLMNKGLEVIEAHYLFGVPYEQIAVLIHRQSVVHSLVRFADGALLAHLGVPDMRTPIGYALTYPSRSPLPMVAPLDLVGRELTFEEPDVATFRCLALAREAGATAAKSGAGGSGGAAPVVLNAANEVAVAAFLDRRLSFTGIADVVAATLERLGDGTCASLDEVFEIDGRARREAEAVVSRAEGPST